MKQLLLIFILSITLGSPMAGAQSRAPRRGGAAGTRLQAAISSAITHSIFLTVRNNIINIPGAPIHINRAEVPLQHVAAAEDDEDSPRHLHLDRQADYIVLAGSQRSIAPAGALSANIMLQYVETVRSESSRMEREGLDAPRLRMGDSGPITERDLGAVTTGPVSAGSPVGLAFYVSGERNIEDTRLDAVAGGGVTFNLGNISSDLSLGIRGSASRTLDIFSALLTPVGSLIEMQNGWFASTRFAVRVFELPLGTLSFIARGQVDETPLGTNLTGWVGLSIAPR